MKIHPSALVSPSAQIGDGVEIGPFCVIAPNVTLGPGCILDGRVDIKEDTVLGEGNRICEGVVIGGMPQHVHMPPEAGRVVIGSRNVIRENVTIHRAMKPDGVTSLGDDNLLMVNAHIAHDCRVGNHTIFANNVMLAGHVTVEDRAFLSGAVGVHQFCRVGALAMVGGQAHIGRDVPPFVTVDGMSSFVVGLNQVGLRRAGYGAETIAQLKAAYRVIYRSGLKWREILQRLQEEFTEGLAAQYYQFLSTTTRGIVCERRTPPNATIKLRVDSEAESEAQSERPLRVKYA